MEHDLELIHSYIKGELSTDAEQSVKARLTKDSQFASLLKQEQILLAAIIHSERVSLKADLKLVSKKGNNRRIWYAVAAAIVPLILISYMLLNSSSDPEVLYNKYYEPYGNYEMGNIRGEGEGEGDSVSVINKIFGAYDQGKYQSVIDDITPLIIEGNNLAYIFYRGVCFVEVGDLQNAQKDFMTVARSESKYAVIGRWHLALNYLQQNKLDECKKVLQELQSGKGGIAKKSKSLLEELD